MARKKKKVNKHVHRFPRLKLDRDMKLAERILHITYNNLARDRVHWDQYDLYTTRFGVMAPTKFALLGQLLVEKKIDPALYIKVMCKYGHYSSSRYLPHATWLAGEEALKIYDWLHVKERKKYQFHEDYKRHLRAANDDDIYEAIKNSAQMVQEVRKLYNLKIVESALFLKMEISPWYWAWVISSVKRELAEEILEWLVLDEKDLKKKVMACTKYYVEHLHVWKKAKQIIRRYL